MDDHACLARAEAEFREAVQREQSALMASGVTRSEATEILLRRLRGGKHPIDAPPSSAPSPPPPPRIPSPEFLTLVNLHGYSAEDAERALTICHEIRLLQAAGIGGVAAAEELTRRVLSGDRNSSIAEVSHGDGSCQGRGVVTAAGGGEGGESGLGSGCTIRRHGRGGGWNIHSQVRSIRGDGSASTFLLPPVPTTPTSWERPPPQEWGNRSVSHGSSEDMAAGGEHVSRQEGGNPGGVAVSQPYPGGRSQRVVNGNGGGRKRGHCGGIVGQGSFPPPSHHGVFAGPSAASLHRGMDGMKGFDEMVGSLHRGTDGMKGFDGTVGSLHRGTDGMKGFDGMVGSLHRGTDGIKGFDGVVGSLHRGTDGMKGFDGMMGSLHRGTDGMDVSMPPLAKRPRFHGSGGVEEGGSEGELGLVGRKEPRQLLLGKEDQEHQLQHAFHQLGVRQKNTSPSPSPLMSMSVVPSKRSRNSSDDSSGSANGKRPRND